MTVTLSPYEQLGGASAITRVVDMLYARLLADEVTAGYFEGRDMAQLRQHMAMLLTTVLGGPKQYDTEKLGPAHASLGITDSAFRRTKLHLLAILFEVGAPMPIIHSVDELVDSLLPVIVTG